LVLGFVLACGTPPTPKEPGSEARIQWERLNSWTGRGDQQLDSFQSDSGALRIEWEAKQTAGAASPGWLKIVVHSSISGRPLAAPVVDQRGEGKGTAYFSEEPRVFFLNVSGKDVDWKISVSERVQ
jgi:hypothetical protein